MVLPGINTQDPTVLESETVRDYIFIQAENEKERVESFTIVMDKARELGVSDEIFNYYQGLSKLKGLSRLWEIPKPIVSNAADQAFNLPDNCLPPALWDYLKAVAEYQQVSPEMCILPLLSTLSLCVQGKAVVKHPHKHHHHETLNLYTLTIADPSMRKSGTLMCFRKPVDEYVKHYNQAHANEIRLYTSKKAALENRLKKLMSATTQDYDEPAIEKIHRELASLEPMTELHMNITDATPEALAQMLPSQGEKIGLLDGESGIFDTISGVYTNGKSNIDIFLKAYGGEPCTIMRVGNVVLLNNPLLTIGTMTQPNHFTETLNNKKFTGRGLMHRFMYSFPPKTVCDDFISNNISYKVKSEYEETINKLLNIKQAEKAHTLQFDKESYNLLRNYSDTLNKTQLKLKNNDNMASWYGKHFGRTEKIAGLLHLCSHDVTEPITADTTAKAIKIAQWSEGQAKKAFGLFEEERENAKAKYIIKRLSEYKKQEISSKELQRLCHMNTDDLTPLLELLEVLGYIDRKPDEEVKKRGRPPIIYLVNPYIF